MNTCTGCGGPAGHEPTWGCVNPPVPEKLYYVTGINFHGGRQTVKVSARNVAHARDLAENVLVRITGRVHRG